MCTRCDYSGFQTSDCLTVGLDLGITVIEDPDAPDSIQTTNVMGLGDTFQGTRSSTSDDDYIAIDLEAGQQYVIEMTGEGAFYDTYLYVRDSTGAVIAQDDDGGLGYFSKLTLDATYTGTYYIQASAYMFHTGTGNYSVTVNVAEEIVPPEPSTIDDMALFLTNGFWGGNSFAFDTSASTQITVDLTGLTADGQKLARWALEAWELVADLNFVETTSGAQITFDDNDSGAYASSQTSGGTIESSTINISTNWLASYGTSVDSYSLQTYIHEIGHALGLGHQGPYNGSANYAADAQFAEDSWQRSVMSYFSQTENTTTTASRAYTASTMIVDVLAIQNLYGASTKTAGNDIWGGQSATTGTYLDTLFAAEASGTDPQKIFAGRNFAYTIFDESGVDTLDLSDNSSNDRIDLNAEMFSDTDGLIGNLAIARGTVIENVEAGSGNDRVTGNSADNDIGGNDGDDTLTGEDGQDKLRGGAGADDLEGNAGNDTLLGGDGNDTLTGGQDNDLMDGGEGDDLIAGGAGRDRVVGSNGNDTVSGGDDRDVLGGGTGNDDISGGNHADRLFGGRGEDTLNGGDGDDRIKGGRDNDTLDGGTGNDEMTGGYGADTFIFAEGYGSDRIEDFALDMDQIALNDDLWNGVLLATDVVSNYASVDANGVVLTFDAGDTLALYGITSTDGLDAAILIF